MEATSMRIEGKQDTLRHYDPKFEEYLSEMFVDYVESIYYDSTITKEEKRREVEEAERRYENALDEYLKEWKDDFYRVWDEADEETRTTMYRYLQDHVKVWLDEREEGRA